MAEIITTARQKREPSFGTRKIAVPIAMLALIATMFGCLSSGTSATPDMVTQAPIQESTTVIGMATATPTQWPATATPSPKPVIIGQTGGECDSGPTSISAEPEVSQSAQPGTALHYFEVTFLQYATKVNRQETEDCAYRTNTNPVYYTLHIRNLDELRAYGKLAYNASDFKLDRIVATAVNRATPTPTPRRSCWEWFGSVSVGNDGSDLPQSKYDGVSYHARKVNCRSGEPDGFTRNNDNFSNSYIKDLVVNLAPDFTERRSFSVLWDAALLSSDSTFYPPTPLSSTPGMCWVWTPAEEYPMITGDDEVMSWNTVPYKCKPGQTQGFTLGFQNNDLPEKWLQFTLRWRGGE